MAQLKKGSTLDGKKLLTAEDVPITAAGDFVFYNGHRIYTEFDKPAPADIDTVSAARGGEFKNLVHFVKGISIGVGVNAIDFKNGMVLKNPTTGLSMDYTGTKNIKYMTGSATNAELVLKPTSADFILKGQITANKVMINGGEAYHTKNSTVDNNGFVRASGSKQSVAVGDFGIGSFMPMETNPTPLDFSRKTGFEAYAASTASSTGQPPSHSSGDTALRISMGTDNNTLLYFNQQSNKLFYHMRAFGKDKDWTEVLTDRNTTNDKSGFVRASGSKDVVTTDQITNSLTSTSVNEVASANLVSKKRDLTNNDFDGITTITGTSYTQGLKLYRTDKDKYLHLLNSSFNDGSLALYGYTDKTKNGNSHSYILRFPETTGTVATVDQIDSSSKVYSDYGIQAAGLPLIGTGSINLIKDSGFKYNNSSANATEENHYPHKNSGVLHKVVLTTGDSNNVESYHAVNSNRMFIRSKLSDKFPGLGKNGWSEVLTDVQHLTQSQGTSKELIPSQDVLNTVKTQLTTEINKKITGGTVSQAVGTSTVNVPSLKLFTDQINLRPLTTTMNTELGKKITGGNVVQAVGTSTVDVPSLKLFTDQINLRPLTTVMNTELGKKVDKTIQVIAGNGMTGGGALSANRTITLGTPTNIGTSTTNNVGTTSHTHALTNEVKTSLKLADTSVQDYSLTGLGTDFTKTDGVMLVNTTVNPIATSGLPSTTWKNALVIGNSRSKASALLMDDNTNYAWIWNSGTKKYNKIMYEDTGLRNFGALGTASINDLGKSEDVGIYHQTANAQALADRGYPTQLAGTLFVLSSAGMTQIYITYNQGQKIFKRNNYGSGAPWSAWVEEMDSTWIVDILGTAKNKVASQFLVNTVNTNLMTEINKKITGGNVVQAVGTSTVDVPSLKLFTDQINLRPLTTVMNTELGKKANNTVNIVAGNGLSGGGTLAANRTLTLGAGTEISTTSGNTVAATSHTHALSAAVKASLTKADNAIPKSDIVQTTGTSTTKIMTQKAVTDAIRKDVEVALPVGIIGFFPVGQAPSGWLLANGSTQKKATYPDLSAYLGSAFSVNTTDFKLPDYRGYFLRGWDSIGLVDPDGATRKFGVPQGDAIRNITGDVNAPIDTNLSTSFTGAFKSTKMFNYGATSNTSRLGFGFDASLIVPTAPENRPSNQIVAIYIRAFGSIDNAGSLDAGKLAQEIVATNGKLDSLDKKLNLHGIGYNQKWVDVTADRKSDTIYTNTTGKPIMVSAASHRRDAIIRIWVDDLLVVESADHLANDGPRITGTVIIPVGSTYKCTFWRQHNATMMWWRELR